MIPNAFINNSSYAKKEEIRMKGNYPLFTHLGTPIKEVKKWVFQKEQKQWFIKDKIKGQVYQL